MNLDVTYLDKVGSTNDFAMQIIQKSHSQKGIIISDHQQSGRGRMGNKWISLNGNLFCSIYKNVNSYKKIKLAQYSALRIVKNYLIQIGVPAIKITIKEPNDILINKKKICGILIESLISKKKIFLIAGIGLNLYKSPNINNYKTTFLKKHIKEVSSNFDLIDYFKKNFKYF